MPDLNGSDKEPVGKRRFMREKIVRPPMSKKQIAMRIVVYLLIAVVAGVAAGVSFAVARPVADRYLGETSSEESSQITISKDEPETPAPTTEPVTTKAVEEETEPIEDILQSAMEKYQFSVDDLNSLYSDLRNITQEADRSIVAVHSVRQQMDWFDNPIEKTGLYAGIIIAYTPWEVVVLTPAAAVENADSIKVAFNEACEVNGIIKQVDSISGMAAISVDISQLDQTLLENIEAIELGNSYSTKQGDFVIAIGSPLGLIHSSCYGEISYVLRNVQVTDGTTRVFYADLNSNAQTGTFLINTSGQMIGWVTDQYSTDGAQQMTVVMSISDYKGILERITNGQPASYFGIMGQEVTASMMEQGLPAGVYVTNSIANGAAYNAGIQNGDIIIKVGEKEIATMRDFQSQIETLNPSESVTVVVQRNGIDEYKEIEFQVIIGAR